MKTKQPLLTCVAKLTCLFAVVLAGLIQTASAQLTIQIVNDSGLADSNIYVMVPGTINLATNPLPPITPAGLYVGKNVGTNVSVALSSLATDGFGIFSITSSVSGNTDTVYSFQADNIASGGIYFIYNQPFGFTNGVTPSPAPGSAGNAYRFDYAELSFATNAGIVNDIDLTYVDKFGIPLQLEWFHGSNTASTNLIAGSYVYASTKTLANAFAGGGLGAAVYGLNNTTNDIVPGWTYTNANSYANFARILSPQKISANSPYPSVTNYLNSLIGHPFVLNGASPQSGYYYLGYQVSVTAVSGGWQFTLAYNPGLVPSGYDTNFFETGGGENNVQYTNTITFTVPDTNAAADVSAYIYGAPVGTNLYSVNGAVVTSNANSSPPNLSYDVETWMIGDVLSSLNFGFAGGIYGNNSEQWFSTLIWPAPYGWAQPADSPASGYYNPYAALMYYNADAYTFAFSERITPDVGMPVQNGDTVRITILPDDRLDSPVVSVQTNLTTANSITLDWNSISGATGYQVNVLRPTGIAPVIVTTTNYMLTGLSNGTPYIVSVQALATGNGNLIITPARPVSTVTTGNSTPFTGNFANVQATFSVQDSFHQLSAVYINGTELTNSGSQWLNNGANANWMASQGTNQVIVKVVDVSGNTVFNDWLQFVVSTPFIFTNNAYFTNSGMLVLTNFVSTNAAMSDVVLFGQSLSQPLPTVSGSPPAGGGNIGTMPGSGTNDVYVTNYVGSATNLVINFPGAAPVTTISLSYVPVENRKSAPALLAPPPGSAVTITGVTTLSGGGIQFNFNVPAGTNYVVESTTNLLSGTWQTNFNGMSQSGSESYTNTAGTNAAQFYRIKM